MRNIFRLGVLSDLQRRKILCEEEGGRGNGRRLPVQGVRGRPEGGDECKKIRRQRFAVQRRRACARVCDFDAPKIPVDEPGRYRRNELGFGVQHDREFCDQYELAGVFGRNAGELSFADARHECAELRFGRDGHRGIVRVDPRIYAQRVQNGR